MKNPIILISVYHITIIMFNHSPSSSLCEDFFSYTVTMNFRNRNISDLEIYPPEILIDFNWLYKYFKGIDSDF